MNSNDLRIYGFTSWIELSKLKENEGKNVPKEPGVYVFRLDNKKFGRLQGMSDILYIGSTDKLYRRIYKNYIKGPGVGTAQRIHNYLINFNYLNKVKISYVKSKDLKKLIIKILNNIENLKELENDLKDLEELKIKDLLLFKLIIKETVKELMEDLIIDIIIGELENLKELKDLLIADLTYELIIKRLKDDKELKNLKSLNKLIEESIDELKRRIYR